MKSNTVSILFVSMLFGLLMSTSAVVMANETNWQLLIKATDLAGENFNVTTSIGCQYTFTDGQDITKGEAVTPGGPEYGHTIATVASEFDNGARGTRDFRAPLTSSLDGKLFTILIYQLSNNGPDLGTIRVTISQGSSTILPPYVIGGGYIEYRFYGVYNRVFHIGQPMPSTFYFDVPARPADDPARLYLMVGVPEPSSIFGLASGLSALALFGFRVRAKNSDK